MFSFLLRLLRPLRLLKPLRPLKSISCWIQLPYFTCFEQKLFEYNDGILNEILPFFRTEAVEDRDVTFNHIQESIVKCPLPMNIQIHFILHISSSKTL